MKIKELFNNGKIEVYRYSGSDEIFVKNLNSGVTMRINAQGEDVVFTAFGFRVEPTRITNGIGYRISSKTSGK